MNQNFYNSNSLGFDQTQPPQFLVIRQPPQEASIKMLHDQENAINSVQTFLRKFNRYSFFETPTVLLLVGDRVFKIKDALGNKQYKPDDTQELFRKLFNDVQNIHEELADTTTHSDNSLPEYEVFHEDHVKENSSGSPTTHSDSSLYASFLFDLSINPFPPADRSDYEFTDEFIPFISLPEILQIMKTLVLMVLSNAHSVFIHWHATFGIIYP
nr:hypothetical protein [Tanacetum cinerariifolium]